MIFGIPHRFAIELELLDDSDGIWMNGNACYWIAGERVGNFDLIDSLRDALFCWEKMSFDKDISNAELFQLNTQELITTLTCGLYNYECADQETYYQRSMEGMWARHNINPGTAAFSGWYVFLVESISTARCLYGYSDCDEIPSGREQILRLGEFNQVLNDAIAYLLEEYQRYGGT